MKSRLVLYRDFINFFLYDSKMGYFTNPENSQLGKLLEPIPFNTFLGQSDFTQYLSDNYPKNHFLTPSEIFKPFYGMTMANFIRDQFDRGLYKDTTKFPRIIG